jgi:beta-lactam-binding protein with PASTA domain
VLLESLGLRLEVLAGAGASRIAEFQPAAGTNLARGMIVRVTAAGAGGEAIRVDITMPNLVGLSVLDAYQRLGSLGQTGFREATCDAGSPGSDPNKGTISSQSVAAGDILPTFKGISFGVTCGVVPASPED